MKIVADKKNNSVVVVIDGVNGVGVIKKEIKIKNIMGWSRHSLPRMAMVDDNNEVLAYLSGGGSYGWIIHCRDLRKRSLLLKVAREAQRAKLYWPWTNVQC